mgnify:CR=1 FL=1
MNTRAIDLLFGCLLLVLTAVFLLWRGSRQEGAVAGGVPLSRESVANPIPPPDVIRKGSPQSLVDSSSGGLQYESKRELCIVPTMAIQTLHLAPDRRDVNAVYSFLKSHGTPANMTVEEVQELKNDLMSKLGNITEPPMDLADTFVSVYRDREQDFVIRDYAVQHLVSLYSKTTHTNLVQSILWEALQETDTSIAGTALLGLSRLSQTCGEFEEARIREAALTMVRSESSGDLPRITAIQVCAEMDVKEALPVAEALARQSASVPLRIAAIAALGAIGGEEQRPFLESIVAGGDQRLQPAARAALQKLQALAET